MPLAPDKDLNVDSAGPLNALEADRFVEDLQPFKFEHFGGAKWVNQHEFLTKLNLQAHVNAAQSRDEFVLEAVVLHEKMPLLIRELIATEMWKQNAYPLIKDWIDKNNSIKGYLLLYNEGVLCNLLEALLYHKQGCEACGDLIVELVDYCHRKLMFLMNVRAPERPADPEALKKQLLKEAAEEHSKDQESSITMSCAMCCLSIVRFLTDHIEELPVAVLARMLDTYDLLMVLCPLLEVKPWQSDGADGTQRRFLQGHWQKVPEAEVRKMSKAEAQCWLAVYNLVHTPSVRKRYQFNTYRKNCLLRVRKFLHESTVDQIPILVDLMRTLDEMQLSEPPSAAEARPAYVMEQLPELREQLAKSVDWHDVVAKQKAEALNDTEEQKRNQAMQLSGIFDLDGMDELLSKEMGVQNEPQKMAYYCQITVSEPENGREYVRVLAESEDDTLAPQSAFVIPADQKQLLVPKAANGGAKVHASLNIGANQSHEVKGTLELVEGRKKQWLQLGFDPYGLRVQLHVLAPPSGDGFHLIHARVTPPPPCTLTLTFVGKKDKATFQVRAKGRGVGAQTPYEVELVDQSIRLPKLCHAKASLVVNAGMGTELEETCSCDETELGLSGATQMVWRQLGADQTALRVQIKLAPASEGGFAITAIRVTAPSKFRVAASNATPSNTKTAPPKQEAAAAAVEEVEPAPAPAPAPPPPPPPPPPPREEVLAADADGEERLVELVNDEPPPPPAAAAAPAPPPPPPAAEENAEYIAAARFGGAKPGYVFQKGAKGVGYYKDRPTIPKGGPPAGAAAASSKKGVSFDAPAAEESKPEDAASAAMKAAADALFAKGDAAGAAKAYTELLVGMPPSTQLGHTALSNRSACYLALQQWEACGADCDEALQSARADLPARAKVKLHLRRAEARCALGLRELARSDVRDAAHIVSSDDLVSAKQIEAFKERLGGITSVAADSAPKGLGLRNMDYAESGDGWRAATASASGADAVAPPPPKKREAAAAAPATPAEVCPKLDVTVNGESPGRSLTLNVSLPGVRTLADITLEISNSSLHVSGAGYKLDAPLPFAVDSSAASAKFSAKAAMLRVKAPEA